MAKKDKKRMAKAGLTKTSDGDPRAVKQDLRRRIRDQREIAQLCTRLEKATRNTDAKLAGMLMTVQRRQELLEAGQGSH